MEKNRFETDRLVLRHIEEFDAENLYKYARDKDIGPAAGWPPHENIFESFDFIKIAVNLEEMYAICLKKDNQLIGLIEIKFLENYAKGECELGFWLGKPFWGNGLMPEAIKAMLLRAFYDLKMNKVWCKYYDGNEKSKRVQEKCGFRYHHTEKNVYIPLLDTKKTVHVNVLEKSYWIKINKKSTF